MVEKLNEAARNKALSDLPLWSIMTDRDAMQRTFKFKNFIANVALNNW